MVTVTYLPQLTSQGGTVRERACCLLAFFRTLSHSLTESLHRRTLPFARSKNDEVAQGSFYVVASACDIFIGEYSLSRTKLLVTTKLSGIPLFLVTSEANQLFLFFTYPSDVDKNLHIL